MLHCISIGCKVNQAEISEIKSKVEQPNIKIGLINTCAVTSVSEAKSRKIIRRFIRDNSDYRLIVTGCFVEAQPDIVRKLIRKDDIAVSNRDKANIPELIKQLTGEYDDSSKQRIMHIGDVEGVKYHNRTRAFLKIQDGCKEFCSYCIVPFLRSEISSKSEKSVEEEAKNLVTNGYKEIVLSGVNLGAYGNLIGLLEKLTRVTGLKRIRLSSIELNDVNDELINLMSRHYNICPHFHIPLQSGSDKILKIMKRKYTVMDYIRRIDFIKSKIEKPSITTDVIVGFPGENDDDFKDSLVACQKVGFSKIHIFCFSPREGTLAWGMRNKVESETIKNRFIRLNNLEKELSLQYKQLFLGKDVNVLVEDSFEGFTERYIRVKIEHDKDDTLSLMRNKIIRVKINEVREKWIKGNHLDK
jgi:threonylcarbamoyladenosine tRNA methylthiotransferase MtaB